MRTTWRAGRAAGYAAAALMLLVGCTAAPQNVVTSDSPATTIGPSESGGEAAPTGADFTSSAATSSAAGSVSPMTSAMTPPMTSPPATPDPRTMASSPVGPVDASPVEVDSLEVAGTIATGLKTPWGVGFLPGGTALVTERDTAKLLAISPDTSHSLRTLGIVDGVVPRGEGGLLGLAVSPGFASDHTVYVYYTAADDNRVAALTLSADATGIVAQRDILTGIPAAGIHNGGRLLMAPDGTLFVSTGDAGVGERAQDLSSLGGKILHIDTDGSPVADPPLPDAPLVYSYGHRNVQGLAFDARGQLWASEFGASTYDELNRIRPGGNYGWPAAEGPSDNPDFVAPYQYWPTSEASPSGLAIVGETALMAALRGVRLWLVPLTGAPGKADPTALLTGDYGRLRTVAVTPNGDVWLTTSNTDGRGNVRPGDDRILRLTLS